MEMIESKQTSMGFLGIKGKLEIPQKISLLTLLAFLQHALTSICVIGSFL
jgi:hypothetical protein